MYIIDNVKEEIGRGVMSLFIIRARDNARESFPPRGELMDI